MAKQEMYTMHKIAAGEAWSQASSSPGQSCPGPAQIRTSRQSRHRPFELADMLGVERLTLIDVLSRAIRKESVVDLDSDQFLTREPIE